MITGREDLLQALVEAFLMEKGSKEFYTEAALKTPGEEAKSAFKRLQDWERRHMDYIQFLYQSILGEWETMSFEEFKKKTPAPLVEGGIPTESLVEKIEEATFIDDAGALALALGIEGKAYNLYRGLSESAADSSVKVFMKEMMEEELRHIDYLKEMRKGLAETS